MQPQLKLFQNFLLNSKHIILLLVHFFSIFFESGSEGVKQQHNWLENCCRIISEIGQEQLLPALGYTIYTSISLHDFHYFIGFHIFVELCIPLQKSGILGKNPGVTKASH